MGNKRIGRCGVCACRARGGGRRGGYEGGSGIGGCAGQVGCVAAWVQARDSEGRRVRRRQFVCEATWGQDRDRGGGGGLGSRESGLGVLGERFRTRETGKWF